MQAFVRNGWYPICWSQELKAGCAFARRMLGDRLVVYRSLTGRVFALEDRCPHRFAPLSLGKVTGELLQCPYHGLTFAADGRCVHNPHGNGATPAALRVAAFPVEEQHSLIWIWMGRSTPQPELLPDLGIMEIAEERHISTRDYLLVKANWRSISNNLLDLSHTSYVHEGILGNAETVRAELRVEADDHTVKVYRDPIVAATPGLFLPLLPDDRGRSKKWNSVHWRSPAVMVVETGVCAPEEDPLKGTGFFGLHLLTPETDTTTHYLFVAVRWNPLTDQSLDPAINARLSEQRRFAFEHQDAPIIEAQQRAIDELGENARPALLASIDAGPMRVQRIIDRLLTAEADIT